MKNSYVWHIAFTQTGNEPFGIYALIQNAHQRRADAVEAARQEDGCGLRCGAFAKRRRVAVEEKAKARPAGA
jgi:hypothetical protein